MFALKLVFLMLAAAAVLAETDSTSEKVEILTEKSYVREDGYNFVYKTSDGTSRTEEGNLITVGDHKGIGIKGTYSYTGPDGQQYQVEYTADDKGYNPTIKVLNGGQ